MEEKIVVFFFERKKKKTRVVSRYDVEKLPLTIKKHARGRKRNKNKKTYRKKLKINKYRTVIYSFVPHDIRRLVDLVEDEGTTFQSM